MNPLYQQMNQVNPQNNPIQRFMQFRQQLTCNPREQVQQLLNTGKITPQQYNEAVNIANQVRGMFGV